MIKGVLFDFNGTLFFDDEQHMAAWEPLFYEITGKGEEDFIYFCDNFVSPSSREAFRLIHQLHDIPCTEEKLDWCVSRKEELYREICIKTDHLELAPGAPELLDYLKENGIPFNLATLSVKENVDFYFDYLKIGKWFDRNKIIFAEGNYQSKQQMYKAAAEAIGLGVEDCLVFEDQPQAINASYEAGVRYAIGVRLKKESRKAEVIQNIGDFTELDYSIFEK